MRELKVGRRRKPVAFGCWNLMLPAGPSAAALSDDSSPAPLTGFLICDGAMAGVN